jgi:Glycosyltransferase family 87
VGPQDVVFAGPPPMLGLFLPFAGMPDDLVRLIWVSGTAAIAVWMLRRLGLPGYWLGFPPIFEVIVLGHPEVLLAGLLLFGGALASPRSSSHTWPWSSSPSAAGGRSGSPWLRSW